MTEAMTEAADDRTGWPRPSRALAAVASVVIVAVIVLLVSAVIRMRAEERMPAGERDLPQSFGVGSIDAQEAMLARLLGIVYDDPSARAPLAGMLDDLQERWANGSIAEQLARAILLKLDGRDRDAVDALVRASDDAQTYGLAQAAEPSLIATAEILRGSSTARRPDKNRTVDDRLDDPALLDVLARWPTPYDDQVFDAARAHLGPFVDLGRSFTLNDVETYKEFEKSGFVTWGALLIVAGWYCLWLLGGLVAVITLWILAAQRRVRSGTGPARRETLVLLEVFALFLLLYAGFGTLAEYLFAPPQGQAPVAGDSSFQLPLHGLAMVGIACASLLWWRVRGGSWRTMRESVGLNLRAGPSATLGIGLTGYALAVFLGGIGVLLALVLTWLAGESNLGNPSHPVLDEITAPGFLSVASLFFVAVIAAPIAEEIAFRGVLYRALRDRLGPSRGAIIAGAIGATLISSAAFAMIHPQGLLAAPVLAGLGAGFCVAREWSGSVVPGMIAHGLTNGVTMTLVTVIFR